MLQIERRLLKNFDWLVFAIIITLAIIGIMTIYSATRPPDFVGTQSDFYLKQIAWLVISITALIGIVCFDYIWLYRLSYPLYAFGLVLLVTVLIFGKSSMGAQRWLNIGLFSFQPSEFFRLLFIIGFSAYLVGRGQDVKGWMSPSTVVIFALLPMLLVVKQPDLGTAIMLVSIFSALVLIKGLEKRVLLFVLLVIVVSIPFIWDIFWEGLKDYQKNRLIAFIEPDIDPAGISYHINQSKIAIGSGEIFGKGFLQGTQGPLRFLPEKHTDFIFAIFAEEWGFVGCMVLFALYLTLFLRGYDTALKAKDEFGRLVAAGITTMFFIYFTVNVGMTLGMMPVVGVPLPFFSYGGTSLLSNFIAAGILINIRTRRFELFY